MFAERVEAFPDGPPAQRTPIALLIALCAAVGAYAAMRAVPLPQMLLAALACSALVAVWITDARRGIVPDAFTLGPLAVALLFAFTRHDWRVLLSIAIPAAPFALAAMVSRGRGMGWGDVKLVALGGALLGVQVSLLAFAFACIVAAAVGLRAGRSVPIAFAPYLAGAIGLALPIGMLR